MPAAFGGLAIAAAVTGAVVTGPGDLSTQAVASQSISGAAEYTGTDSTDRRQTAISRDLDSRRKLAVAAGQSAATVEGRAAERDALLQRLAQDANENARRLAANRWILPVRDYHLTGRFGDVSSLWSTMHTGLDFAAPTGTNIRSIAAGTVTETGSAGPYGNRTIITLRDGTEIWYCHQYRIMVGVGDRVAAADVIGEVGSTGNVTGPHLHLEVRPPGSGPIDPEVAFPKHGATP